MNIYYNVNSNNVFNQDMLIIENVKWRKKNIQQQPHCFQNGHKNYCS